MSLSRMLLKKLRHADEKDALIERVFFFSMRAHFQVNS